MNSFLWHCCNVIYSVLLQNQSVCSLKWMFDGICRLYVDISSECCTLTTCNPVLSMLHQVTQRSICVYLLWFVNVNYLYFSLKRAFVMYCITVFLDLSCHSAIDVKLKITLWMFTTEQGGGFYIVVTSECCTDIYFHDPHSQILLIWSNCDF